MDFVDYVDRAAFLRIQDTFSRFSLAVFVGDEKSEDQTVEMSLETVISNWLAVFGAPAILVAGKD